MARPRLIKINMGGLVILAKQTVMPDTDDPSDVVCPHCAPIGTQMNPIADLVQWGMGQDHIFTFFKCTRCNQQVFVEYYLDLSDPGEEPEPHATPTEST